MNRFVGWACWRVMFLLDLNLIRSEIVGHESFDHTNSVEKGNERNSLCRTMVVFEEHTSTRGLRTRKPILNITGFEFRKLT